MKTQCSDGASERTLTSFSFSPARSRRLGAAAELHRRHPHLVTQHGEGDAHGRKPGAPVAGLARCTETVLRTSSPSTFVPSFTTTRLSPPAVPSLSRRAAWPRATPGRVQWSMKKLGRKSMNVATAGSRFPTSASRLKYSCCRGEDETGHRGRRDHEHELPPAVHVDQQELRVEDHTKGSTTVRRA